MKLTLVLSTEERLALRRFAKEAGEDLGSAARSALRDGLLSAGYLELEHELDEDMETVGEA